MRSITLGPIAFSLALHAGAAMLALNVSPTRQAPPPRHDLTIGLAILPTTPVLSEPSADLPAVPDAPPPSAPDPGAITSPVKSIVPDEAPSAPPPAEAPEKAPESMAAVESPAATATGAPEAVAAPPPVEAAVKSPPAAPDDPGKAAMDAVPVETAGTPPQTMASTDAPIAADAPVPLAPSASEPPQEVPAADVPATAPSFAAIDAVPAPPTVVSDAAATIAAGSSAPIPELPPAPAATVTSTASVPAAPQDTPLTTAAPDSPAIPGTPSLASTDPATAIPSLAPAPPPAEPVTTLAAIPASPIVPDAVRTQEVDESLAPDSLRRAEQFIAGYEGGPCFFLSAIRASRDRADVDAFALADDPFGVFDRSFTATVGFEANVIGQKIWKPQCPAIDFLRDIHGQRGAPPTIQLQNVPNDDTAPLHGTMRDRAKSVTVRGTAPLSGTIHDPAHRPLHLFAVSETGAVKDISDLLVPAGKDFAFTFVAGRRVADGPLPQLLVAVAGESAVLRSAPAGAPEFFSALAAEADRRPDSLAAAAKLFLLSD